MKKPTQAKDLSDHLPDAIDTHESVGFARYAVYEQDDDHRGGRFAEVLDVFTSDVIWHVEVDDQEEAEQEIAALTMEDLI